MAPALRQNCALEWRRHEARLAAATDLKQAADRLLQSTAALIGPAAIGNDRFGIAVSGGPDSLALLLLANAAFAGRIEAATVDHQLRQESAAEAAFVASICAARGIPHQTLVPAHPIIGSVQANARAARYGLLDHWRQERRLDWLMTAHHADDQLETLVMRANRSSGVGGMAGIRARQGIILRPLLDWRHSELVHLAQAEGLSPVDDPSNRDHRYDRARIRPALRDCTLVDPVAVNAVACNLAEADAALDWATARLAAERLNIAGGTATLDVGDLPSELVRRLLLRALAGITAQPFQPRGTQISAVIQALATGAQAMIGTVLIRPDRRIAGRWQLRQAPAPRQTAGTAVAVAARE